MPQDSAVNQSNCSPTGCFRHLNRSKKTKGAHATSQFSITGTRKMNKNSNHINGTENDLDDSKSINTFVRNTLVISGGVTRHGRSETVDHDGPISTSIYNSPCSKQFGKAEKLKNKIKRSRSVDNLYHKRKCGYHSDSDSSSSLGSSLESLIRHNLSITKALQPLSVSKAKQRNFLHGRAGAESNLGRNELARIFPKSEVTIFIATWNMNGEEPPSNLNELLLSDTMENLADIYVIGTQESYSETTEWEVAIQETIGPSHVLFHSKTLGTIFLGVYIRRELIWYCSLPEDDSCSVRPGAAFKTKGAVGLCFYLFGSSFLFVSSHLTAHDDKLQDRISDIFRIMKSLELPKILPVNRRAMFKKTIPNVVHKFDYVFWFGDLNFRITQPRDQVLQWMATQKFPLDPNMPFPFYDQLMSSMKKGLVFRNFQEAPITFPPSYKFDCGSQTYDTSHKKRTPSYTDRILFKTRKSSRSILTAFSNYTSVKCLSYTSVPAFCSSDHKPVWGLYTCKLRAGIDSMPLNAGMFNREIYIEAMKRRAVHHRSGFSLSDSKSCVIQ